MKSPWMPLLTVLLMNFIHYPVKAQTPPAATFSLSIQNDNRGVSREGEFFNKFTAELGSSSVRFVGQPLPQINLISSGFSPENPSSSESILANLNYFFSTRLTTQEQYQRVLDAGLFRFEGFSVLFTQSIIGVQAATGVTISSRDVVSGNFTDIQNSLAFSCSEVDTSECRRADFLIPLRTSLFANPDTFSFSGRISLFATIANRGNDVGLYSPFILATIDPVISLQLDGVETSEFEILLSSGIGNGPRLDAIPEPSSWIMMIFGFGLIGLACRNRKRRMVFRTGRYQ